MWGPRPPEWRIPFLWFKARRTSTSPPIVALHRKTWRPNCSHPSRQRAGQAKRWWCEARSQNFPSFGANSHHNYHSMCVSDHGLTSCCGHPLLHDFSFSILCSLPHQLLPHLLHLSSMDNINPARQPVRAPVPGTTRDEQDMRRMRKPQELNVSSVECAAGARVGRIES